VDRLIDGFAAEYDDDLMLTLCGVAYQKDMTPTADYGADYFDKCAGYEGSEIGDAINAARIALVARHYTGRVCDVGIGSGTFVSSRPDTFGIDINPRAIAWLRAHGLLAKGGDVFAAHTFWDVLEHLPTPADYLDLVPLHGFVFVSIPIFADLYKIRESKHYRPGEHLYYWMHEGFVYWMGLHGFNMLESNDAETIAGRDSIRSYAFKRNRFTRK
jgi:SAM-dependent methyltransferase